MTSIDGIDIPGADINNDDIKGVLGEVGGRLPGLSAEKVVALVQKLDLIAAHPGVEALREQVRPVIRSLRPPRALQLKRLLCVPFEDLLVSDPALARSDRLLRRAIRPYWESLERWGGAKVAGLTAELLRAQPGDAAAIADILRRGAELAAAALTAALAAQPLAPRVAEHRASLGVMRDALLAEPEIQGFKRVKPAGPLPALDGEAAALVSAGLKALMATKRPIDAFLLVIAARLEFPAELSGHLETAETIDTGLDRVARAAARRLIDQAVTAQLADRVQSFERLTAEQIQGGGDAGLCAAAVDRLIRQLESGRQSAEPGKSHDYDTRAAVVGEVARAALAGLVIEPAVDVICRAMPDGNAPSDPAVIAAAEDHARALVRARHSANRLGLARAQRAAETRICETYIARARAIGAAQPGSGPDAAAGPSAQALSQAVRMVELLSGSVEALALLRKIQGPVIVEPEPNPFSSGR